MKCLVQLIVPAIRSPLPRDPPKLPLRRSILVASARFSQIPDKFDDPALGSIGIVGTQHRFDQGGSNLRSEGGKPRWH